ncbi:MAG: DNA polymerase III subunit delta' [Rhizobiaceae bacterium]
MELEQRSVADRLEGVPIPAECNQVVGHDEAMLRLTQSYQSGKMPHAWLLVGAKGSGKATLAFMMAKHILSHPDHHYAPNQLELDSIVDTVSKQIAHGAHPDLLHLTRSWNDKTKKFASKLSIDEIRRTNRFYGMTAGAGGWRITIIDTADDMNRNAANALLKILEEPPKRSLFFVLSNAPGNLLPTIRSRCQVLSLAPLKQADVLAILSKLAVQASDKDKTTAIELAEGSVRKTIQLLRGEIIKEYQQFETLMNSNAVGSAKEWKIAHDIANAITRKGQEQSFELFLDLVIGWIGKQVRREPTLPPETLASWASVWEKVNLSILENKTYNLDKKQVILSLFEVLFERNKT